MARPKNCRRVIFRPRCTFFKPSGIPKSALKVLALTVDELEALRLADLEGLYQAEAARSMNVSRPTFGRIVESARHKAAQALVHGYALKIEGGEIEMTTRKFTCYDCQHTWDIPYGTGRPQECPSCKSTNIHRAEEDRGYARNRGGGRGRNRGRGSVGP